jgi:hypothetical protein
MQDIKLAQNFSSLGLMVLAVGVAQIFVHGGGGARDRRKKIIAFFHVL